MFRTKSVLVGHRKSQPIADRVFVFNNTSYLLPAHQLQFKTKSLCLLTTESQATTDLAAVLKTTCYPYPIRSVGSTDVHSDLYSALTSRQSTPQLGLQTRYNPMILIVLYTSLHSSAPDNTVTLITALPVHSSVLDVQPNVLIVSHTYLHSSALHNAVTHQYRPDITALVDWA